MNLFASSTIVSMVRRLEKRFKNILTMNIVFWRAVIAGDNATYGDKMRFSVTF
jgi:hypothetical protein